jgi:type VI secretion system secreted protein Hcp
MSFQYYVSVTGKKQGAFKPESTKQGRKDKFVECIAFKMGSAVPYDANSGLARGYRQFEPLMITKEWGASSPQFLQAHWTNEVLNEVVLEIVSRTDDGTKEFVLERITLTDAVVVAVRRYSATHAKDTVTTDVDHLEDISFRFRQIMVENPKAGTSTTDNWEAPGS